MDGTEHMAVMRRHTMVATRRRMEREAAAAWNAGDGVHGRRRGVAAALEWRNERRRCGVGKNRESEAGVRGQER